MRENLVLLLYVLVVVWVSMITVTAITLCTLKAMSYDSRKRVIDGCKRIVLFLRGLGRKR